MPERQNLVEAASPTPLSAWLRDPAGPQSITIGRTRLTHVPDGWAQLDARHYLPDPSGKDWSELGGYLDAEGYLMCTMGGVLVERDDRAMLIDTGFGSRCVARGEHPGAPVGGVDTGHIRESLAALGTPAEAIEIVAITHMHGDHVNGIFPWAAEGEQRLAFENARHLFDRDEWGYWSRPDVEGELSREQFIDPMARLMDRGSHAGTFAGGDTIFPGVRAWQTPGHTPGHTSFVVSDGGVEVVVLGDAIHSPAQLTRDDWTFVADSDPLRAQRTRTVVVDEMISRNMIGYAGHFGAAVFGRFGRPAPDDRPAWTRLADAG